VPHEVCDSYCNRKCPRDEPIPDEVKTAPDDTVSCTMNALHAVHACAQYQDTNTKDDTEERAADSAGKRCAMAVAEADAMLAVTGRVTMTCDDLSGNTADAPRDCAADRGQGDEAPVPETTSVTNTLT
jgi:hypothetical protein